MPGSAVRGTTRVPRSHLPPRPRRCRRAGSGKPWRDRIPSRRAWPRPRPHSTPRALAVCWTAASSDFSCAIGSPAPVLRAALGRLEFDDGRAAVACSVRSSAVATAARMRHASRMTGATNCGAASRLRMHETPRHRPRAAADTEWPSTSAPDRCPAWRACRPRLARPSAASRSTTSNTPCGWMDPGMWMGSRSQVVRSASPKRTATSASHAGLRKPVLERVESRRRRRRRAAARSRAPPGIQRRPKARHIAVTFSP